MIPRRFAAPGDGGDGGAAAYAAALVGFLARHRALWGLHAVDFLTERQW
jgi:hypothetical protein